MKNEMRPVPFEELLSHCIREYQERKSFFGVPVKKNVHAMPVGPAAGPHTQLAQNIVAAYAAGAMIFELKTVQVLEGEQLGIVKPCIYVGSEVYNTEWSTELTVKEAAAEYIKAAMLIQVLSKEYDLTPFGELSFIMSVGYNLEGITGEKVDTFIETMKDAGKSEEWNRDVKYLKDNISLFDRLTLADIDLFSSAICETVTLSTMHGCPADEIERIAKYLLEGKKLNTYVKMNPTLLGERFIETVLHMKHYEIDLPKEMFEADIDFACARDIISNCMQLADMRGLSFGVKLTNTLPVINHGEELSGAQKYMSGDALYALSINTAYQLAREFDGKLHISYSGGADDKNCSRIFATGIAPVTVSSYLLKPGGYRNLSKLLDFAEIPPAIDLEKLETLASAAIHDENYHKKPVKKFVTRDHYNMFCAVCHNCEDICPNRANIRVKTSFGDVVIHDANRCNECGVCACFCVMGHKPYLEKADRIEENYAI